jgi:hypothetical protein
MAKPKMKMSAALSSSLKAEENAVRDRFEKAEGVFTAKEQNQQIPSDKQGSQQAQSEVQPITDKQRVIRDSFTLPLDDYSKIASLQQRCLEAAVSVNKSELIRAGLHALETLPEDQLLDIIAGVQKIKTGRPAAKK